MSGVTFSWRVGPTKAHAYPRRVSERRLDAFFKFSVVVAAIALVVAACAPQEAEFTYRPQAVVNTPDLAPDMSWDYTDGYHVDLHGVGMGNEDDFMNNAAMINIPNGDTAEFIRVQVQIKGGLDDSEFISQPTMVVFTSDNGGQAPIVVDTVAGGVGPGVDGFYATDFGWHYNATMLPANNVTATVYVEDGAGGDEVATLTNCDAGPNLDASICSPRAFNAWVFYAADASNPANSGGLFQDDLWWGTTVLSANPAFDRSSATHTIPIAPALGPRDVTVEFALSDLENDDRTAKVIFVANGQMVMETYDSTPPPGTYEEELLIDSLTLMGVPGNVSSVDVTFISPDGDAGSAPHLSGGDSFFASGAAVSAGPIDLSFGRFTGGINHYNDNELGTFTVTGGLTLHCDITLSNNLEINWNDGTQNRWHIEKESLTEVLCSDDPEIEQRPPRAPLDTLMAEAIGRLTYDGLRNEGGSIIHFTIVDGGEPGRKDMIDFKIWLPGDDPAVDTPILNVAGYLQRGGNLQAHYDQPHGNKPPKN